MKALIYSHGSRGDIQPYLALAYALNRAGHSATLVGPRLYGPWVAEYGVDFAPVNDEGVRLHSRPDVREILVNNERSTDEYQKARDRIFQEIFPRLYPLMLKDMWDATASGADLVIHSHSSRQAVHQIAEKLGVPHVLASLYPHFVASRRYPADVGTFDERPDNLEQHAQVNDRPIKGPLAEMFAGWRTDVLGLPPREGSLDNRFRADGTPAPVLMGFSPHVLEPAPDWPEWVHTTGFWMLPPTPGWRPPQRLLRFLESGEKPVFIGFGSHLGIDPEQTGRAVVEAVRRTGVRAVVVTGWGGVVIPDPPEHLLVAEEIPYDWLFPQVRAVVHPGGTGTHNAALKAGVPQVICPFQKEGVMWADHLHALGVAPAPVRHRDLTADSLTEALHLALTDPGIARTVARLAERTAPENGAENAVRVLEKIVA
ncbi:glycosyl transferase family 1 [Streptomyces caniferus]|uniref:Glycosyl transferase family 1 n=1 Tax=Streptomyces caniferus TaxID=285557 RepID=A0A640S570_9ACTN|nr:glycosyltransferase [Streptomyces caniferus]GFE05621.1 glycosyl transferase family 1 [Streptomyces caniferus]